VTSDPTKAMKAAVVGRPFHIRFGGRTDFLYVADCADAFIRAASADLEGSHVFNSHGESVEMSAVVEEIEKLIPEAKGRITFDPTPLALPPELDDSAIVRALGDVPHTPLSQGMKETIERFAFLRHAGNLDLADLDV
jgi:nucleoside-diphosphate-sugar epimerase